MSRSFSRKAHERATSGLVPLCTGHTRALGPRVPAPPPVGIQRSVGDGGGGGGGGRKVRAITISQAAIFRSLGILFTLPTALMPRSVQVYSLRRMRV